MTELATRGTTNKNVSGNNEDRRRRRAWLVETYRADVDVVVTETDTGVMEPVIELALFPVALGFAQPACRCYRCGCLLTIDTVTVDRIIPGCYGGTYRRNNIRPACGPCNSSTGAALASVPKNRSKR